MKKAIVFIFNNSWGEIDFILPIMREISVKKTYTLITIFDKQHLYDARDGYRDLFYFLEKYSSHIFFPKMFRRDFKHDIIVVFNTLNFSLMTIKNLTKLFFNLFFSTNFPLISSRNQHRNGIVKTIKKLFQTKYIVCSDPWGDFVDFTEYFPNARFILYPHAIKPPFKLMVQTQNELIQDNEKKQKEKFSPMSKYPLGTVFFSSHKENVKIWKSYCPKNINIVPIGYSRLQDVWVDEIKRISNYSKNKRKSLKNILLLNAKEWYVGVNELTKKVRSIFDIARKYSLSVYYKPHPRSNVILNDSEGNVFSIHDIIIDYNDVNIIEVNDSVMTSALNVDLAVLTYRSSSALDCIMVGTPVIEYFRYNNGIFDTMLREFEIDGKKTGIYRYYGLVYPIDEEDDFQRFIAEVNDNPHKLEEISKAQRVALDKINYNYGKVFDTALQYID